MVLPCSFVKDVLIQVRQAAQALALGLTIPYYGPDYDLQHCTLKHEQFNKHNVLCGNKFYHIKPFFFGKYTISAFSYLRVIY